MRMRDSKISARIQGRDGPNAARMYYAFRICSRFSGEAPEKLRDSRFTESGEETL